MRVGAEYQARIPDFEPGKSLFGCNLTCRSPGGRDGVGAGVGSARGSPGGGSGIVLILLFQPLCWRSGGGGGRLAGAASALGAPGGGDIAGGNFHFTINHIMCIRREAVRQEKVGCAF